MVDPAGRPFILPEGSGKDGISAAAAALIFSGRHFSAGTRTRLNNFSEKPYPAIYDAKTGTTVRPVPVTQEFVRFSASIAGKELFARRLTEDLRYLVAVPYFGARPGVKQGFNHDKAYCYDMRADKFFTMAPSFSTGTMSIADAESVDGRLLFAVFADQKRLGIVDGHSDPLAELPAEGVNYFSYAAGTHWDYAAKRVLISASEIEIKDPNRRITLYDYDYEKKSGRKFRLATGELEAPPAVNK
ncbi:MAG TPA: hypothetical protein DDW67_10265 [Elusimicrobia bacterium]|nr:hypothetical protein [Elusimicrobiota bacterium]